MQCFLLLLWTSSLFIISEQSNYINLKVLFRFYSLCFTGLCNDVEHDGREGVCVCVIVREANRMAER